MVKAPSHLSALPLVFATYPDARVVITHRDPLRVVGSLADTMATLHWMHSDRVAHEILIEFLCMGLELQMNAVTKERDSGTLPVDQIADVGYQDLVDDPIGTVTAALRDMGHGAVRRGVSSHGRSTSTRATPTAQVAKAATTTTGSRTPASIWPSTAALVADYQERFGVPSEV